jgi:hypothetical protein
MFSASSEELYHIFFPSFTLIAVIVIAIYHTGIPVAISKDDQYGLTETGDA